jgi:hypothetical protein
MAGPTAAFPFIEVKIVPPPPPLAQRSPGVIAVVGKAPANNNGGEAPANTPMRIETLDDAVTNFARLQVGSVVRNALYDSLGLEPALPADPIGGNLPGQPMDLLEVKARRRSAKSRPGPATSQGQERHPGRRGRRPRDVGGPGRGIPKRQDGLVEMIWALRVARRSAMKARIQAGNQLLGLLTRAPGELRARLWKLRGRNLVEAALGLEPAPGMPASVTAATEITLSTSPRMPDSYGQQYPSRGTHGSERGWDVDDLAPVIPGVGFAMWPMSRHTRRRSPPISPMVLDNSCGQ